MRFPWKRQCSLVLAESNPRSELGKLAGLFMDEQARMMAACQRSV